MEIVVTHSGGGSGPKGAQSAPAAPKKTSHTDKKDMGKSLKKFTKALDATIDYGVADTSAPGQHSKSVTLIADFDGRKCTVTVNWSNLNDADVAAIDKALATATA